MTEFSWTWLSLEVNKSLDALNNVVINVSWVLRAKDGFFTSFEIGSTQLSAPDPTKFVDLNSITSQDLESWVTSKEDVPALQQRLIKCIEDQKTQTTFTVSFTNNMGL